MRERELRDRNRGTDTERKGGRTQERKEKERGEQNLFNTCFYL